MADSRKFYQCSDSTVREEMAENRFSEMGSLTPEQIEEARQRAIELGRNAQAQARQWLKYMETKVVQNPAASLGAALAVGVFLGWLIKRR